MVQEIIPIWFDLPYRMGSVNCYLIQTDKGFILIDTGSPGNKKELEIKLERSGCTRENLQLIVLTHGDFDHTGNAAFLRNKYRTKIAIHPGDAKIVESGNMFINRKKGNVILGWIVKTLFRFNKSRQFLPDLEIGDGFDLAGYGFDARVVHIPGHSNGSIGILTANRELFCGDLLENTKGGSNPQVGSLIDDRETAYKSVEKLKTLDIDTVYPGHGRPFSMQAFVSGAVAEK